MAAAERLTRLLKKPAPGNAEWNLFLATACTDLDHALGLSSQPRAVAGAGQGGGHCDVAELKRWGAMRDAKLKSPVALHVQTINFDEDNDLRLINVLAEAISMCLPELLEKVMPALGERQAALFGERVLFALNVEARDFTSRNECVPGLFPGISGRRSYSAQEILFHVAAVLDWHRDAIRKEILSHMPVGSLERCLLAEAVALAQCVMDREEGNEEIEDWEQHIGPAPVSFQDAWQAKADYYKHRLGKIAAERQGEDEQPPTKAA